MLVDLVKPRQAKAGLDQRSWCDHGIGADACVVADQSAEFLDASVNDGSLPDDADALVVHFIAIVRYDCAGLDVDAGADDRVADKTQMRDLGAAEHHGGFQFAGRTDDAILTQEHPAPKIRARSDE